MLKQLKFQEVRHYIAEWENSTNKPNNAFGILMCIGYLRRERLNQEELTILREIEVMVKNSLSDFLEQYEIFMDGSFLLARAQELKAELDEELVEIFCQLRDEQQMSFDLIQEYTQELDLPSQTIPKVRNFLLACDEEICWDKDTVIAIQEAGYEDPLLDQDVYWWHNKPNSNACWVPNYIKEKWMAMACDNSLTQKQNALLQLHLQQCNDCSTQYEWLLELFQPVANSVKVIPKAGVVLPYLQLRPTLAAASGNDFREINLLDGEIIGNVAKEYGEIVYRLSTNNIEFKSVRVVIEIDNIEKKSCIFLPYGDELALFPIENSQICDSPMITFPCRDDIQIDKVKLYQEL